jgi:hypothetical protein
VRLRGQNKGMRLRRAGVVRRVGVVVVVVVVLYLFLVLVLVLYLDTYSLRNVR